MQVCLSVCLYTQWKSCQLQPVLCLGWSAMQQVVTLHPDATVIMSIVVSVPLSHVWPDCRRESEDLRTCQNFGFAQFCTIM